MKRRWSLLFAVSLVGLAGTSWLAQRLGIDSGLLWSNVRIAGMIVAAGIAFVAMLKRTRDRRFAIGVATACAPAALMWIAEAGSIGIWISAFGAPALLMIAGSFLTIAVAIWILATPLPPDEPGLAEARLR